MYPAFLGWGTSLNAYNEYYAEENEAAFASKSLTKRLYFQQKDTTRDCLKFIEINLPELEPRLWQKIFAKKDSILQLRHKIIHGDRPSLKDIEDNYTVKNLESALFEITQCVY